MCRQNLKYWLVVIGLAISSTASWASNSEISLSELGARGDGVYDDSAALQKGADVLAARPGAIIVGEPGKSYALRSGIVLQGDFRLDLRGATLKPIGAISNLFYRSPAKTIDIPVIAGAESGSAQVSLQSTDGLAAGDLVRFTTDAVAGLLVPSYRTVERVRGRDISLSSPLPYRYPGTVLLHKANFLGDFSLRNATVDGSAWVKPNAVVFVGGYVNVVIDSITVKHCVGGTANWVVPQVNRYVRIENSHFIDNQITVSGESINVWDSEDATIRNNEINGQGFGIAILRSDQALVENNTVVGDAIDRPTTSVRGIKLVGCLGAVIRGNRIRNYVDAIKSEDSGRLLIADNIISNVSIGDVTSYAIAVANQHPDREHQGGNQILRNTIRGSGGSGIYLGPGSPDCVVEDNDIKDVGSFGIAIFTDSPGGHVVRRNRIENFDMAGRSTAGIYLGASATAEANVILEETGTKQGIRIGKMARDSILRRNELPRNNPVVQQ